METVHGTECASAGDWRVITGLLVGSGMAPGMVPKTSALLLYSCGSLQSERELEVWPACGVSSFSALI